MNRLMFLFRAMGLVFFFLLFGVTGVSQFAFGADAAALIQKIDVSGYKKIEKDAILAKLKSQVGAPYDAEAIKEDIQNVFKLGYFNDVRVFTESVEETAADGKKTRGLLLTYQVVEKPSITEIKVEGNSEIKTEELLETFGVKAYEIYNASKVRDGIEKLRKAYEDKGYYLARIDNAVENVTPESVRLKLTIKENDKVRVKKITLLGNHRIKDGQIKAKFALAEQGFFSFLSGSGAYKQEAFEHDMEVLKFLYYDEGYVEVKIDKPNVYVTPDRKSIYVTIHIDEGEQFDVGDVDFSGDLLFSRDELFEDIQINKRTIFSYGVLRNDLSTLQAKYGDLGYAYANIIPRTRVNSRERKVDVTFEIDKGNKVYYGKFQVVGNTRTRDKVVRREMRIFEGELYNETRKRESLERIQRLGFFEEVNFKTSTEPGKPDIMNIDIVVKERNTGTLQMSAGYGSVTGFTLGGQVTQTNFLGRGQRLSASLNLSQEGSLYNFNFTEPYFLDSKWSVGFDAYQSILNRYDYIENTLGGAFTFGHPIADNVTASLRYKYEHTILDPVYDSYHATITDYALFPLDTASGDTSSVTGILEYDKRNDRFSPTKGAYASTSLEYAGLGGSLRYTQGGATFRYFHKMFWEVVWRNNVNYGFITAHDQDGEPPFNKLFLLGGPYSLRGYQFSRVGKTVYSQATYNRLMAEGGITTDNAYIQAQKPYGGKQKLLYQTEFEFPLIAEAGIKGVFFFDAGEADDALSADGIYSDVGFGFRWYSILGPLRFEFGFPLRSIDTSPDPSVFEFSIGTPF